MPRRIAAARMNAKKRSPRTSLSFQSASAATTIPQPTSVATAAFFAVSVIAPIFPRRTATEQVRRAIRTYVRAVSWPFHGSRRAGRPRRPGAQPEGHHGPAPAERPHLHHGPLRLRQVEPRLRHDLRRGPAPLRRVALRVRAPVPADDGEAGRRLDRRLEPRDLDRPEDDVAEPALHRRHGHRDLRLPPPALRAGRPSPLPGLRPPDRGPVDRL